MDTRVDLVVVGGGAAGLGAARAARAAGRRVALVERARPGGDCTFHGCIPSKTLLDVAARAAATRDGRRLGLPEPGPVDFPAVVRHVQAVVEQVAEDESPELLRREGVHLVTGVARVVAADDAGAQVEVAPDGDEGGATQRLSTRRVVLATGARAAVPPLEGLADVPYLTNETVFHLDALPDHLVVLGGGSIGVELAQAFSRLGSRVTVVEQQPRLLGREEPEAAAAVRRALGRDGVTVRTGTAVTRVAAGPVLHLADGSEVAGSHLLVVVGRRPVTDGLGLAAVGIGTDRSGAVVTDAHLRTAVRSVYAAGDCTSALQLTHVADAQGRLAAANAFARTRRLPGLLGGSSAFDDRVVPWVTFTDPEVGRVGLTEDEAYQRYGRRARVAVVSLAETDRSRTASRTDGYVKLVAGPRRGAPARLLDEVVGLTAVAPHGGELAGTAALAMGARVLAARLALTIAPYPTYALALRVAAARLYGTYGGASWRPAAPAAERGEVG